MNLWHLARAQWDRAVGGGLFVLGGLAILLGWIGVSREALTARQIPYVLSGGIGGIFLLGLGAVFWLSADMRDEWRKLDAIERAGSAPASDPSQPLPVDDPWAAAAEPAPAPTNGHARLRPLRARA